MLRRDGGLGRAVKHRRASSSSRCRFPASTTSTTRCAPQRPGIELGAGLDEVQAGPRAHDGRLRPRGATSARRREVAILLVKNPAGANEVLRTLRARAAARSTSGLALNDRIADGRDMSWVWDADFEVLLDACGASRARGRGRGDGATAEVRGDGRARSRWTATWDGRSTPRWLPPTAPACTPCRPTPRCSSCATSCRRAAPFQAGRMSRARPGEATARPADEATVWHDVECGGYTADLPLWRELAATAGGPVLDLGAGTGRVALDLAERGHEVSALDTEPALLAALRLRARERGLRVRTAAGDARAFTLGARFALVIAPMQVAQLLGGRQGRRAMLACDTGICTPAGVLALALADPLEGMPADDALPPLPDVRELDGWVYSSRPVAVRESHGDGHRARARGRVPGRRPAPVGLGRGARPRRGDEYAEQARRPASAACRGGRCPPPSRTWEATVVVLEAA